MYRPRILLADNDPEFLKSCGEYLELAGYRVSLAGSVAKARQVLENWVHLAILDLRLTDDEDDKDISGLTLARESSPEIPKLILTRYQSWEAVREALRMADSDRPPAVDFVAKQEKLEGLLKHIHEAFQRHVRIRWDLDIDWQTSDIYSLTNLIEAGLESETILQRAEELSDLFRLLLKEHDQVRVDHLLWHDRRRAALVVYPFNGGFPAQAYIVVCGERQAILTERENYTDFAPEAPSDTGSALKGMAQTIHYAANAYALAGADLETTHTLAKNYLASPEKDFHTSLRGLFQETLADWHQNRRVIDENSSLAGRYRQRLELSGQTAPIEELDERLRTIVLQSRAIGIDLQLDENSLAFQVGRQALTFPHPLQVVSAGAYDEPGVALVKTPGYLSGRNILATRVANASGAADGRTWLTDFLSAGWAPLPWNAVLLEAELRFDRIETGNLQQIYAIETSLLAEDFTRLDIRDIDAPLRKPLRTILEIRKLAARMLERDLAAYHLGIYFLALKRVEEFRLGTHLMQNELARLAHAVVSLAMSSQALAGATPLPDQASSSSRPQGIVIDLPDRQVWVEGELVEPGPTEFELLAYLFERANRLCRREDVFAHVYGRAYTKDEDYLLNTVIDRLRDKIEPERGRPRYLITKHGVGYILKL